MKRTFRSAAALTALTLAMANPVSAQGTKHSGPAGGGKIQNGVVTVLDFDGNWTTFVPFLTSTPVVTGKCITAPYLAGPNDIAIIALDATFLTAENQGYFFLRAAFSADGSPFTTMQHQASITSLTSGAGHVSLHKKLALTEGVTYVFGPQFNSNIVVGNGFSTCHGTVTIVRGAS